MKLFNGIKKHMRQLKLGVITAAAITTIGAAVLGNTSTAVAASGNDIMYGGATSCQNFIDKVRGSAELQKVYAAFGLQAADYTNFAQHCVQGLANRNNTITVDNRVVATGVGSIGRWQSSQGANPVAFSIPGVGQSTFYGNYNSNNFSSGTNSIPVSLLLDPYGGVKFAAMVTVCGNPTYQNKVPHYACNSLVKTAVSGAANTYDFSVNATAYNASIDHIIYHFSDTNTDVRTFNTSTKVRHTFSRNGTVTATLVVRLPNGGSTTVIGNCITNVVYIPPAATYVCDALTFALSEFNPQGYRTATFTAKAHASNATIKTYTINPGDGKASIVVTANNHTSVTATHLYAPGNYKAILTATFLTNTGKTVTATSTNCQKPISFSPLASSLSCSDFTLNPGAIDQVTGNQLYTLSAKANANHATVTNYHFSFGDNSGAKDVATNQTTASAQHTYALGNYTASVIITGKDVYGKTITSSPYQCQAPIKVKTAECKPGIPVGSPQCSTLTCVNLSLVPGTKNDDGSQIYTLNATASADNATITSYVFDFGDGSQAQTVTTGNTTASATPHLYTPGNFTAKVSVNGTDASGRAIPNVTSAACAQPVAPTPPQPKNPAIKLTKVVDGVKYKQVAIGQNFVYQLVITNTGEKDLTSALVTDAAPAGVTMISADLGTITDNSFSYNIPTLAVGQSVTINITAVINAYVAGNVINTACVDTPDVPNQPGQSGDSCDQATVSVPPVTPPTVLPNTGAGSVLSLFGATVIVGTVGYRLFLGRRMSRQ